MFNRLKVNPRRDWAIVVTLGLTLVFSLIIWRLANFIIFEQELAAVANTSGSLTLKTDQIKRLAELINQQAVRHEVIINAGPRLKDPSL